MSWQDNIYDFIYSCDFYISTSINEGLGNAYLASKLLNKQSLCSNIPASLEINSLFGNGISFDINAVDIGEKIKNISQGFVPYIISAPKSQASIDYIFRENQLN